MLRLKHNGKSDEEAKDYLEKRGEKERERERREKKERSRDLGQQFRIAEAQQISSLYPVVERVSSRLATRPVAFNIFPFKYREQLVRRKKENQVSLLPRFSQLVSLRSSSLLLSSCRTEQGRTERKRCFHFCFHSGEWKSVASLEPRS